MKLMNALFFALIILVSLIQAEPGCMDNSWHLQKAFDNKDYHYVNCNCECTKRHKILADRGKCLQCGHYREPKNFIIIGQPEYDAQLTTTHARKSCSKVVHNECKKCR